MRKGEAFLPNMDKAETLNAPDALLLNGVITQQSVLRPGSSRSRSNRCYRFMQPIFVLFLILLCLYCFFTLQILKFFKY